MSELTDTMHEMIMRHREINKGVDPSSIDMHPNTKEIYFNDLLRNLGAASRKSHDPSSYFMGIQIKTDPSLPIGNIYLKK